MNAGREEMETGIVLPTPPYHIETPRLVVRLAEVSEARSVADFYRKNRERLRPFDPERPSFFFEESFWIRQLAQNMEDFTSGRALRLFLFPKESPERVVGNITFSSFMRSVAQCCTLGYSIDGDYEGRGLMAEALRGAIDVIFHTLNFHRIEANYMPHNRRSGLLLRRLGFVVEGYARDYLRINGRWEDHIRTALINPDWIPPLGD